MCCKTKKYILSYYTTLFLFIKKLLIILVVTPHNSITFIYLLKNY
uniref:Uncharacterized protein n=1 Tax=viral metagenome TaxID=1070528 RepID=A0A6C0IXT3_9ZZZZ